MRVRVPRAIYGLLFVYIAISLAYQLTGSVSLIVGYFDMRHQVNELPFSISDYGTTISDTAETAKQAGMAAGDTIETLNGVPFREERTSRRRAGLPTSTTIFWWGFGSRMGAG